MYSLRVPVFMEPPPVVVSEMLTMCMVDGYMVIFF
jgi:hypothetical protein